jgi:hypothetical protein
LVGGNRHGIHTFQECGHAPRDNPAGLSDIAFQLHRDVVWCAFLYRVRGWDAFRNALLL